MFLSLKKANLGESTRILKKRGKKGQMFSETLKRECLCPHWTIGHKTKSHKTKSYNAISWHFLKKKILYISLNYSGPVIL